MAVKAVHDSDLYLCLSSAAELVPSERAWGNSASAGTPVELPSFDLLSDGPLPPIPDDFEPRRSRVGTADTARVPSFSRRAVPATAARPRGRFWFDGDVLMCACPDCGAPTTVRLWLMLADCWLCGTSIELTEEQEREIRQLLKERAEANQQAVRSGDQELPSQNGPGKVAVDGGVSTREAAIRPIAPEDSRPEMAVRQNGHATQRRDRSKLAPAAVTRARQRMREIVGARSATAQLHEFFKLTPAWLVSLVLHFLLLTILALLTPWNDETDEEPLITLALSVDNEVREGGEIQIADPKDEVQFDLPLPSNLNLKNERLRETIILADQDARELRLDEDNPQRADLELVKRLIHSEPSPRRTFAARDPRVRIEIVKKEGGTTLTEAAVARGLRWLALHQNQDGSWSLHAFDKAANCSCGPGDKKEKNDKQREQLVRNDAAGTSLALLPFLGAGQTHLTGRYKDTVATGLRWLIDQQEPDGYLGGGGGDGRWWSEMYAHGQAAIVLCEAYAIEGDESLRGPAQKGIDLITQSQYTDGGWRYAPQQSQSGSNSRGDTSVFGWQLMALHSARAANLHVDEDTLLLAGHYLDSVQKGFLYAYQRSEGPTQTMTAEALLCRMYLGWTRDMLSLRSAVDWLSVKHPPKLSEINYYYWYYAAQAMHHYGGPAWERWNLKMRDYLVDRQEKKGHEAGSWPPMDGYDQKGGRIYTTSLATCTLEVYYRHLPLFKQIDLD